MIFASFACLGTFNMISIRLFSNEASHVEGGFYHRECQRADIDFYIKISFIHLCIECRGPVTVVQKREKNGNELS
jgi:hypothetical protein